MRSEQGKEASCSRLVKKSLRFGRQSTGDPRPVPSQASSREDSGAVRSIRRACRGAPIRDPAARRTQAPLRLPARARRRAGELGGAKRSPASAWRAPSCGARGGSPARLRGFRGHDSGWRVRRRHGRDLGSGDVRAPRGEARRRTDREAARGAPRRRLDARSGCPRRRREELAPPAQGRSPRLVAGTSRCSQLLPMCSRRARAGSTSPSGTAFARS